jgi:hypothetical protein
MIHAGCGFQIDAISSIPCSAGKKDFLSPPGLACRRLPAFA